VKKMFLVAIALSSVLVAALAWPQRAKNLVATLKEYAGKVQIEKQILAERREITRELSVMHNQSDLDDQQKARRASLESKLVQNSTAMQYHVQSKVETLRNVKLKRPHHQLIPAIVAVNETRVAAYARITKIEGLLYGGVKSGVTSDSLLIEFEQATSDLRRAEEELAALRSKTSLDPRAQ
jgi:hypothetical protein